MGDYWHKRWACPFFCMSKKNEIRCESGYIKKYSCDRALHSYAAQYCTSVSGWKECETALEILKRYEKGKRAGI